MVVYTNADFISLNEENLTYSVLVEDKGKIAYIGYNTPLCYRDAKVVDLEGKAVLPAVNDPTASVEAVYLKGRDTSKSRFPFFHI